MSSENEIKSNPLAKIFVFFFIIVFFCIGVKLLYSGITTKNKGEDINITISHIEKKISKTGTGTHKRTNIAHTVYVNYTYKNIEYTNVKYNVYTSKMHEGDTIKAKINPDNPREFYYSSSNIKTGIFIIAISIAIGVIFMLAMRNKES